MKKYFVPAILILFAILTFIIYNLKRSCPQYDFNAIMIGNIMLAALSMSGYFIVRRQIGQKANAFVRGVYSATLLKLMICMGAILIYAVLNRAHLHKPTVFVLLGLYIVYNIVETAMLSRIVKQE